MSLKIGFVLLTHNKPQQAVRLVKRLNDMFGAPPIAWHHDFTQCALPFDSITKNASLVRPHIKTSWGQFSLPEAMLSALKLLFETKAPPDWFILLSGADYPIKSAERIALDLSRSPYDVHMNHEKIVFRTKQGLEYARIQARAQQCVATVASIEADDLRPTMIPHRQSSSFGCAYSKIELVQRRLVAGVPG
jgi:hypothetical protein